MFQNLYTAVKFTVTQLFCIEFKHFFVLEAQQLASCCTFSRAFIIYLSESTFSKTEDSVKVKTQGLDKQL